MALTSASYRMCIHSQPAPHGSLNTRSDGSVIVACDWDADHPVLCSPMPVACGPWLSFVCAGFRADTIQTGRMPVHQLFEGILQLRYAAVAASG
jgi:hypothetical protein